MKNKILSPTQVQFLQEYMMNGGNATQAMLKINPDMDYHAAGQKAHYILKSEEARDYLQKQNMIMEEQSRITRSVIETELFELLAACKTDDDRQHLLKTIDIMNKMAGHYVTKSQVDVKSDGIVINFVKPNADN